MYTWKNGDRQFGSSPIPTNGCGHLVCFEETDYIEDAGENCKMVITFDTDHPPETEIVIAGILFRIKHVDNKLASEFYYNSSGNRSDWITETGLKLQQHQAFRDYNIEWDLDEHFLSIRSKDPQFCPQFSQTDLKSDTTGMLRGSENGQGESSGIEPTYKEDYYAFLRIIDPETGQSICENDFEVPMNVFNDGSTKACFELSSIIRQLPKIFVTPPEVGDALYFQDQNQKKWFSIESYGKYKDQERDCGKVQTLIESVGGGLQRSGYPFVRMIQQVDAPSNFGQYFGAPNGQLRFMTDKPQEYKICKDSPMYYRWHYRMPLAGDPLTFNLVAEMTYGDGTTEVINEQIYDNTLATENYDIHVLNLQNIMYNSQYFNQNKSFLKLVFKIEYYLTAFNSGDLTEEHTLLFDNSPTGHCCGCHKQFLFQGETGNHDPIVARCESIINKEIEFTKIGRIQECGEYQGGTVPHSTTNDEEIKTVWIYTDEWEYLSKFLASPIKHVKKMIGSAERWVRIYPTETSYEIYTANDAGRIKFSYVENIQKKSY